MNKQEKFDFIKEWFSFRENMCKKHNNDCSTCPLFESADGYPDGKGGYEYLNNCKYDFEDSYAEDIIDLMEKSKE